MADMLYDSHLDAWKDWASGSLQFTWLALDPSYDPDPSNQYISDVVGHELTGGNYTRQPVNGRVRFVDVSRHRIIYTCDDPNFGALDPGNTIGYLLVAEVRSNDDISPLLGLYDIEAYDTDGSEFYPAVGSNGINYISQTVV